MKKPARTKLPKDTNMRMHSILADVVAISNKPIKAPKRTNVSKKRK